MEIEITESDYKRALGPHATKQLANGKKEVVLGETKTDRVLEMLPRVLADRVARMLPEDFEIREITLKVIVSGTPFGVGVSADASIKFSPKPTK